MGFNGLFLFIEFEFSLQSNDRNEFELNNNTHSGIFVLYFYNLKTYLNSHHDSMNFSSVSFCPFQQFTEKFVF